MRAKLDAFLNNWISKKLMVFCVAAAGLFWGTLTSSDFVNISMVYLGSQGAIDAIKQLRANKSN
jgi:hypothetical protein